MKKAIVIYLIFMLTMASLMFPLALMEKPVKAFTGGTGTAADPYQISNWTHLANMSSNLTANYILTTNLSPATDGYDTYASSSANGGAGWLPIGNSTNKFTGNFSGAGFSISDLYINNSEDINVGLFGDAEDSYFDNITILDARITSATSGPSHPYYFRTGILVGESWYCSFVDIHVNGSINGTCQGAGGMVGCHYPELYGAHPITRCSADVFIDAFADEDDDLIVFMGGLVGMTTGYSEGYTDLDIVKDSYAIGTITGNSSFEFFWTGSLIGTMISAAITNSYGAVFLDVYDNNNKNALVGNNLSLTLNDCFYDTDVCNATQVGATGNTTAEMTDWENSYPGVYTNWSWVYPWLKNSTGYPVLGTNVKTILTSPNVDPDTGAEQVTSFEFNVTIQDDDTDGTLRNHFREVYLVINHGASEFSNISMSWVSGDNFTAAIYNTSTTILAMGTYTYLFSVYDGHEWNFTTPVTLEIVEGATFNINFPTFLEVGQYILANGILKNVSGYPISNQWAQTRVLNSTNSEVAGSNLSDYIMNGLYRYTFSTSTMTPEIYTISVNFSYEGEEYITNRTLYLSDYSGPGHYATNAYFTFYDANTGVGIEPLSFKIYASDTSTLTAAHRIYGNIYPRTYTGDTIYYRIDDYFDNQIYPAAGTYETATVDTVNQFIDVPIDWNSLSVKNINESIVYFSIEHGVRTYSQYIFPNEAFDWNVLSGDYNLTIQYYDLTTGALVDTNTSTLSVTDNTYYWITGYTLEDIFLQGEELKNRSIVIFNFYNTNEGLGLPMETLQIYINGSRMGGNLIHVCNNTIINVTIKDYYNTTLYWNNFTITAPYTFIDLGLTFHSYKIKNQNDVAYILSFLKSGGARWWEKAVYPQEIVEFLLPSGDYDFRIYDSEYTMLFEDSILPVNNSMGYVIDGSNLTTVISGLSTITGQLLELASDLHAATMPDVVRVVGGIPKIYSVYETEGALLGTVLVCPAKVLTAETTNTTTINETEITFYPLMPDDNLTDNGTVFIKEDYMYFEGDGYVTQVNISYNNTFVNLTYIPNRIDLFGENVTVNCTGTMKATRKTSYQQYWKFYWTKYTATNLYEATIDIDNNLYIPINKSYVYVEFANDTTPDYNTVDMYDVTNGVYLTRGENFYTTASGVHFYLDSMDGSSTRTFKFTYYGVDDPVVPSNAITIVHGYSIETVTKEISGSTTDKNYYALTAQWRNNFGTAFVGDLEIQFNFDLKDKNIAPNSWIVLDVDNNQYLDREDYAYHGGGLRITQDTLGTVNANKVRNFKAWFLFSDEPEPDRAETKFFETDMGGGFLVVHLILGLIALPLIGGIILSQKKKEYMWLALMFAIILFLFIMWQKAILF